MTVNEFLAMCAYQDGDLESYRYWTYEAIDPVKEKRAREAQEIRYELEERGYVEAPKPFKR